MLARPLRRLARALPAVVALAAAPLPRAAAAQDYSYAFRVTPTDDEPFAGTMRVSGDRARMDVEGPDRGPRDYLLLADAGRAITIVNPRERSYTTTTTEAFERIVATALGAVQVAMSNKLTDVRVHPERLGAGDTIAGFPTQRYRLTQEFTTNVSVMGIDAESEYQVVITDFWAAPGLKLMRNPLVEMLATAETGLAQTDRGFVQRSAAARDALFTGMPLRLIVASRSTRTGDRHGKPDRPSQLVVEVTRVVRGPVDRAALDLPSGYRKEAGLSWNMGGGE